MKVMEWAEPTGRQTSSGTNRMVADTLMAAPVDEKSPEGYRIWAIVEEHELPTDALEAKGVRAQASNRASLIKHGRLGPFKPKGTFDAVSRTEPQTVEYVEVAEGNIQRVESPTKVVRVYARYKGAEFAEPEKVNPVTEDAVSDTTSDNAADVNTDDVVGASV